MFPKYESIIHEVSVLCVQACVRHVISLDNCEDEFMLEVGLTLLDLYAQQLVVFENLRIFRAEICLDVRRMRERNLFYTRE